MHKILNRLSVIPLWSILVLSLSLKVLVFCYIGPWHKEVVKERIFSWGDAMEYETLGESLYKSHTFTVPDDTLNPKHLSELQQTWLLYNQAGSFRVPVYPDIIASIYFLTGIKPYVVLLVQILYSLFSLWFVYQICLLLFNQKAVATLAALFYSLDIHTIYCTNLFAPDMLLTTLFLAAIYFFLKFIQNKNTWNILISAIFLGISCLTKPVSMFYPAVIILLFFVFYKSSFTKKLIYIAIYLLSFGAVTGVWAYRNYVEYNHLSLTTQAGFNLITCNVAYSVAKQTHQDIDTVKIKYQREANVMGFLDKDDPFYRSAIYQKLASSYMKKNWYNFTKCNMEGAVIGTYFSLGYMGMAKMFQWTDSSSGEKTLAVSTNMGGLYKHLTMDWRQTSLGLIIFLSLLIQYSLAVWGIYTLIKDKQYMALLLILITIAYFTAITGVVGNYRYKLPIVPFLCIMTGYGCYYWITRKRISNDTSREF